MHFTLVSSSYGDQHEFIDGERARKNEVFAGIWYRFLRRFVGEGKVKCHPVEVLERWLDGVVGRLRRLKEREVSARKLVVR